MKVLIEKIIDLGIGQDNDFLLRRRTRLLNSFVLMISALVIFYVLVNVIVGSYFHAMIIFSGIFIIGFPTLYFNHRKKHILSRTYFIITLLFFINLVAYNAIFHFQDRSNEILVVGFSSLILVMYENPMKLIMFVLCVISALGFQLVRLMLGEIPLNNDFVLSLTNTTVAFVCVYFFTAVFKNDLIKSIEKISISNEKLKEQQKKIEAYSIRQESDRRLLQTLIDNIPVHLVMLDTEGRYVIANSKYLESFGVDLNEIEGKKYSEIMSQEMSDFAATYVERALMGEELEFDRPARLPNGDKFHAYGKYIPLLNDDGKVASVLVCVTDISKIKEAEKKLIDLNNTKDKLLSIISHDLKSPINTLKGLLTISSIKPSEFQYLTQQIKKQVDNVSFTMDNLLNWVKTQLDGFKVNIELIDLTQIINDCIKLYEENLKDKDITILNNLDDSLMVQADADNMHLVFRNLLSNAIKFTPKKGKITLRATFDSSTLTVTLVDSGVGIPKRTLKNILKGNTSNSSYGTEGEKGTGLGLSFCRDVIGLNKGQLVLKSEENKGTQVSVLLPFNQYL